VHITVTHINHPPLVTYSGDSVVHEDSLLHATIAVSDPDQGDSAFVINSALPPWLTLSGTTLLGAPKPGDAGKVTLSIVVSDIEGLKDTLVKQIVVLFTNHPPTLVSWNMPDSVRMNSPLVGRFQVQDIDKNDSVFASWTVHPSWLVLQKGADSASLHTFTLSGTPASANVGPNAYSLRIADKNGASFVVTKSIFVVKVNLPPVAIINKNLTIMRVGAVRYFVSATDDQDTTFTFNATLRSLDDSTFSTIANAANVAVATMSFYPLTDGRYEFSVYAIDHQGAQSTVAQRDTFTVTGASHAQFNGDTNWQMVSLPSRSFPIGQVSGSGYAQHWDESLAEVPIYGYYRSADELVQTMPGLSYWRLASDTTRISLTRNNLIDSAIHLKLSKDACGWNQIASPYPYPVQWTSTSGAWKWNSATLDFEDANGTLAPWQGYWVQTDTAATILFDNTPDFSTPSLSKRFSAHFASTSEWQVRVIFSNSVNTDAQNILGLSSSARDGFNVNDAAEPPRMNGQQCLYFFHPEWKRAVTQYARDIRKTLADPMVFQMGISPSSGNARDAKITFDGLVNCSGVYFFLADATSIVQVTDGQSYPIVESTKVLYKTLFVTPDRNFLNRYPKMFELASPYPNPIRQIANIKYTLPYRFAPDGSMSTDPYSVKLALYDARGRLVRQLVYSPKSPGMYATRWDGKDNSGLFVSAGIFILRLEAGQFTGAKRIIVVK
jgi:hypothetical protein